tara:strand:+ start:2559 stop:3473 length:915 start_codon:yes stop_codon:yes gene_type:complete
MIRFIEHQHMDTEKWDACVKRSVNSLPYAFSWYLDIVVPEWDALVLDDYQAVFPLPYKKRLFLKYSFTPFWVQQLGLFYIESEDRHLLPDFINAIPDSYRFIDLNMNHFASLVPTNEINVIERSNYELRLNRSYSDMESDYSKNLIRNLKKSKQNYLQIFKNDSPKNLINLFKQDKGEQMSHLSEFDYQNLDRIMHVAIHKNCGQVLMVYGEGNQLQAGMFLLFGVNRVIFLFSGNSILGRENGAMPFLIDSFFKESANSSFTFDFEGSDDEDLARFYRGFGGENHSYQNLKMNRLPFPLSYFK